MKNRNLWFINFYLLLAIFIIYQLVYLICLYQNHDLKALYTNGFDIVVSTNTFNSSNYASIFYIPLMGLLISSVGFIGCILHSRIFINKLPHFKFIFLIGAFCIFTAGFLISFVGELFYLEWNNNIAIIDPKSKNPNHSFFTADHFYQNWIASSAITWSIFGLFVGLIVGCVILIIKLNLINVQMFNYQSQHEKEEYFEPELRNPLPSSNEFDPNESQTITIFLDNENNKRIILQTADEYDDYEEIKSNTKKIKPKIKKQKKQKK